MKEFKDFLLKTNALSLAVGVILGGAVGKVVSSLVTDVLMPPLGLLLGNVDFSQKFITLGRASYATLAEAQKAGSPTLNYGLFLNSLVDFVIVSFCIFVITKIAMKPAPAPAGPAGPAMKECPQCGEQILSVAKRCRYCTSTV